MKKKFINVLLLGLVLGIIFSIPVLVLGVSDDTSNSLEGKAVVNAKVDFGATGDGLNDDTQALQNAFNYCSLNHTTLFIPNGKYLFTNLHMDDSFNLEGENRYYTELKSIGTSGAALDLSGRSGVTLSNFTIESAGIIKGISEALDYGIKIDSDSSGSFSENIKISNVEVRNLRKENTVGCYVNNVKMLDCNNSSFHTLNGSAFKISGTSSNAGVYNFRVVLFGNQLSGKYGLEIMDGSNIDSIAFEGCYFGGTKSAEKIGGNSNVASVIHNGCHYENRTQGETQLVEVVNDANSSISGLRWNSCTFVGFGACKNAFSFAPDGTYKAIDIVDCEFNNILSSGYVINNTSSRFTDCELKIALCVSTRPNIFSGPIFVDNDEWVGGWTYTDVFTDFKSGLKLNGSKVSASTKMPSTGSYSAGDFVYNVAPPEESGDPGSKYIVEGWKRVTNGSSHDKNADWLEMRAYTGR